MAAAARQTQGLAEDRLDHRLINEIHHAIIEIQRVIIKIQRVIIKIQREKSKSCSSKFEFPVVDKAALC